MATVSKKLADEIRDANGYYADDPRVMRIVEYTDMGGKQAYGLEYEWQLGKYSESPYIRNPKTYWIA
jgi:hypothetical protein